jgi:hypothetical protein
VDKERAYTEFRNEIYKRELSNSENFDKAILTYASGALAVSLAFLKDFVPIYKAKSPWLLYSSWAFFATCIAATVASYLFSQWGIKRQLASARKYYLEGLEDALNQKNMPASINDWLNVVSGVLFCGAIFMTTIFIGINAKEASMSDKKQTLIEAAPVPGIERLIGSGDSVEERAAPVPAITPLPSTATPTVPETIQPPPSPSGTKKNRSESLIFRAGSYIF